MHIDHQFAAPRELAPRGSAQGRARSRRGAARLSLALQGGGSFGAFTWGVLDGLLEAGHAAALDQVSGASAGAVNAVLLASGLAEGGADRARVRLRSFWERVGSLGRTGPWGVPQAAGFVLDAMQLSTRLLSPYQLNPLGLNPLRDLLAAEVDFERLRAAPPVKLMVAATRVRDGQLRLFREDEVSLDAVLASACLPYLNHAVEIDDEAYWDGGYSANPPLKQLALETAARDVLLVQIMPDHRDDLPRMPQDISRRLNEMAFHAAFKRELDAVEDLRAACAGPRLLQPEACRRLRRLRVHKLDAADWVPALAGHSMLDMGTGFLEELHDAGRRAAAVWLNGFEAG